MSKYSIERPRPNRDKRPFAAGHKTFGPTDNMRLHVTSAEIAAGARSMERALERARWSHR